MLGYEQSRLHKASGLNIGISTKRLSDDNTRSGSIGMEVIGGVNGKRNRTGSVDRYGTNEVMFGVTLIRLVRIVDRIIKSHVLLAISNSRIDVRWKDVSNDYESILCVDFVVGVVEGIPLVYSMQNRCLDMPGIIIDNGDLEIMITLGRDNYVLNIEMRVISSLDV